MGLVGSYTVAGHPGAGADRVINYNQPAHFAQERMMQTRQEAKQAQEEERAKQKFVSSNGKIVNFTKGAEMLNQDRIAMQPQIDDYINWRADYIAKGGNGKDSEFQREDNLRQQKIIDNISKAQQHYKISKALRADRERFPKFYKTEEFDKGMDAWENDPKRPDQPGVSRKGQSDFLTPALKYKPEPDPVGYTEMLPNGSKRQYKGTKFNEQRAREQADAFLKQPAGQDLIAYALDNGIATIHPEWAQMDPKVVGQIAYDTAKEMVVQTFRNQTKDGITTSDTKPTDGGVAQYNLDDAIKKTVVARDVPIKVTYYNEATKNGVKGSATSVHDMKVQYAVAVPQSAKTKATIPASANVTNIQTGKPIDNPDQFLFVPGTVGTWFHNGKVESVVFGTAVNKVMKDKVTRDPSNPDNFIVEQVPGTEVMDVKIPLKDMANVLKQANVQIDWTKDAEKRLNEIAKKGSIQRLNGGSTAPAPTKSKAAKKMIGNLN